jgi:hypothetical protein
LRGCSRWRFSNNSFFGVIPNEVRNPYLTLTHAFRACRDSSLRSE